MIRVYCENITQRHRYIFDFIFRDVLATSYLLTDNREEFIASDLPGISYSRIPAGNTLHFCPQGLLSEKEVMEQEITMTEWRGLPVFFQVDSPSAVPFDPFAMAFYLVSRYEEYLPFKPDEHGRFRAENSLAVRAGFLQIPLVNAIFHEIRVLLSEKYPGLAMSPVPFHFIPSFDIDIAYAHLGKGKARAVAAWMKLLLKADFSQIKERINVIRGKIPDPYDNFMLHRELAEKYGHRLIYFVLLGDFGRYDRNTGHRNRRFRALLNELSEYAGIGIHPSYRSYLNPQIIRNEITRLEQVTGKSVLSSRFHFLRLKLPDSYRQLAAAGIKEDFSMGYSDVNGFRAGTCTPFFFYDLIREEQTELKIHPFIFMDSAMIDHMKLQPDAAPEEIRALTGQVMKYGGEAVGIWHNYSLCGKDQYKGWQEVLMKTLSYYNRTNG